MAESARTGQAPYPELDAIPPAPQRSKASSAGASSSSLFPVPRWAVRLFSTFPLYTWPDAELISPTPTPPPRKPTLYVSPHLNRDGTLASPGGSSSSAAAQGSRSRSGWSSSDPICLRWQMELMFRGVDFDVEFIDPVQSWGPGRQVPFLHLPPSFQPPTQSAASSSSSWLGARRGAAVPSLLTASALPHFLDNHFPLYRPELGEKAEEPNQVWEDKAAELESRSWTKLLSGRIMAGVLLAVLLSPHSATTLEKQEQPYLSSLLSSQLQNTFLDDQLRRISALHPRDRAQPTSRLPGWEVGFLGWVGASAVAGGSASDAALEGGDDYLRFADPVVDEDKIIDEAARGLDALGLRTRSELEEGTSKWLLGARQPTQLDALAFAIIHTVMTLAATPEFSATPSEASQSSVSSNKRALLRLKEALDGRPWLVSWSRRVWKEFVREKERA